MICFWNRDFRQIPKFGRFYQLPWQLAGLNILNMLVSYKWLKELVDIDVASAELAEKMSTTGIEVEGVTFCFINFVNKQYWIFII